MSHPEELKRATLAVTGGRKHQTGEGLVPGIELSSTFVAPGNPAPGDYTYGRGDSPGFRDLEQALALIEHATDTVVFNAGIAASNVLFDGAPEGKAVVMPYDAYYGIRVRAETVMPPRGCEVRFVDQQDLDAVDTALVGAGFLWTETPTNPLLAVANLTAIGELAARHGVPWACDNTFATPALQRPLEFGAMASMSSLTKYIGGHSDLILGSVAVRDSELAATLRQRRSSSGTQPDGFSCWLARRGLQTMPLRVERQSANALELALRLSRHPSIEAVYYPGLSSHPGHDIAAAQMDGGFGGMLSIIVAGGADGAQSILDRVELWVPATSLGGVESLIERRARWSGEVADPALLRLSTGIEDVDDLWRDLEQALDA